MTLRSLFSSAMHRLAAPLLVLGITLGGTAPAVSAEPRTLLVLGDSISAGYGLPPGT